MAHRHPRTIDKSDRCPVAVWLVCALLVGLVLYSAKVAAAQTGSELHGRALVEMLRQGGFNIYFRHAATDWSQADQVSKADDWTNCDPARMRQLSDTGRQVASTIGEAMRVLHIPVGNVFASPYCRTVETARLMQLGEVETTTDIMNTRVAAYFGSASAIAERTRQRLSTVPPAGTNIVLVAHGNILRTATGVYPQEAEAIVFRPEGRGRFSVVARLSPQTWRRLVAEHGDR